MMITESQTSSAYTRIAMYSAGICDTGMLVTEGPSPRLPSDLCRPARVTDTSGIDLFRT